jgi:serine/threonine kinase PknH
LVKPLTGDDPQEIAGYQVRARLGAGGMGRVYLALTRGGRPVAIKVVRAEFGDDEEFRDRFRHEVIAAQRVHGLYTAQVLDADPDAQPPWLATAYVPGLSLQQAVTRHGPLPPDSVFLLIAGVAEALQAIHAAGIVHRDLKPSNVILAADGPRVIDFGIAWAATAPALTRSGISIGSPPFMAPEQARGQPSTASVDVFALGSLATFAVVGHPPFGVDEAVHVLYRVLNEPPNLDGCPPDMRPLLERCLAKDPEQRPRTSEIIETCRARTAGGGLAFERSWLPAAVFAAAVGGTGAPFAPLGADPVGAEDPAELTFPSEVGQSAAEAADKGTSSGEVHDPPEWTGAGASAPWMPNTGDRVRPDALAAVEIPAGPGDAGPGDADPGGAGAAPPPNGRSGPNKVLVGGAVAGLLIAAAAVGVTLLSRPVDQSGTLAGGRRSPDAVAAHGSAAAKAHGHRTATPQGGTTGSSHSGPVSSGPGGGSQPGSAPLPGRPTSPATTSPSSAPAAPDRGDFGGTWSGTVSQPGWPVPSWTVELVIPASGTTGSWDSPSQGCSGRLILPATATATMNAVAATTVRPVGSGCTIRARLTLVLSGSEIGLTWTPVEHPLVPGSATLTAG